MSSALAAADFLRGWARREAEILERRATEVLERRRGGGREAQRREEPKHRW